MLRFTEQAAVRRRRPQGSCSSRINIWRCQRLGWRFGFRGAPPDAPLKQPRLQRSASDAQRDILTGEILSAALTAGIPCDDWLAGEAAKRFSSAEAATMWLLTDGQQLAAGRGGAHAAAAPFAEPGRSAAAAGGAPPADEMADLRQQLREMQLLQHQAQEQAAAARQQASAAQQQASTAQRQAREQAETAQRERAAALGQAAAAEQQAQQQLVAARQQAAQQVAAAEQRALEADAKFRFHRSICNTYQQLYFEVTAVRVLALARRAQ